MLYCILKNNYQVFQHILSIVLYFAISFLRTFIPFAVNTQKSNQLYLSPSRTIEVVSDVMIIIVVFKGEFHHHNSKRTLHLHNPHVVLFFL